MIHWMWYSLLPELSPRQKRALLEHFSDPEEIYNTEDFRHIPDLSPEMVKNLCNKDLHQARETVRSCTDARVSILCFQDAAYPRLLKGIADPPMVLYYKGTLPDLETRPVIGVVGTRKASMYGLTCAKNLSAEIAACGGLVVSGGAAGVDSLALEGAMEAGGQVAAVLGGGVDVIYPAKNKALFAEITENGCLLSEYPPGTPTRPWQFPQRNRIISGMAHGLLVVEAPERSGALITARDAAEQGRDLFAVPGNINVATCAGSNQLLQEGAGAVFSGWDVVKEYQAVFPDTVEQRKPNLRADRQANMRLVAQAPVMPGKENDKKDIDNPTHNNYSVLDDTKDLLTEEEQAIVACLSTTPKSVDAVIAEVGLPAGRVNTVLARLALKRVVEHHPGRLVSVKIQ